MSESETFCMLFFICVFSEVEFFLQLCFDLFLIPNLLLMMLQQKFLCSLCFMALLACTFLACTPPASKELPVNLIPLPVSLEMGKGSFELGEDAVIYVQQGEGEVWAVGQQLAAILRPSTGYALPVEAVEKLPAEGHIYLSLRTVPEEDLGEEGYYLEVSQHGIVLQAPRPEGLFRGIQSLRQLFPPAIEASSVQSGPWEVPVVRIRDYPRFGYRGAMLDVARHFFEVEEVKRYIDLIAAYKMNVLHLHLTDDQGWRIEIKSWPRLAEYGGSTEVGGGKGGYFTQEQYKEIVQHAQERYVTIVPEIDWPGHTQAALASYPELSCSGKKEELYTGIEVGFSTLCTSKEITYQFAEDVIRELAALTPGPYIHIGGDESHATKMEDYLPFVERIQQIVHRHGKEVIGWDEIAHSQLLPNTVVQYWDKAENAKMAIEKGAKVLMSPAKKIYLDMQYDSTTQFGLHWAAYIEVDDAYKWDPETLVEGITKEHIVGVEAPLWSETVTNLDEAGFMAFPRLPGVAEIGWSPADMRDWETYKVRLGWHGPRMEVMGIHFYRSDRVPWQSSKQKMAHVHEAK